VDIIIERSEGDAAANLICPGCEGRDTIAELDQATRVNQLVEARWDGDGTLVLGWSPGDTQFEHDAYTCTECWNDTLTFPPDVRFTEHY
jgi:hypothetical protein